MHGMGGGSQALDNASCHRTTTGAVQSDPFQLLSPMVPTRAPVIALAPGRWVEPGRTAPALPRLISGTAEPPPPRLV